MSDRRAPWDHAGQCIMLLEDLAYELYGAPFIIPRAPVRL